MCLTLSWSTAYWMTLRQFRSVCTTTLAMLRWTNTSPGAMPMIWLAGTRESEQPIHRYSGCCCRDNWLKNSGSSCSMRSAQSLLFCSSMRMSFMVELPLRWWMGEGIAASGDVAGNGSSGAGTQRLHHARAQFLVAGGPRRLHFVQREAAHQRVFLVQAVEGDELGVEQLRAGGVLAVVAQGVAVAVQHFGGAGRAHAQAGPDQGGAEAGQPPLV